MLGESLPNGKLFNSKVTDAGAKVGQIQQSKRLSIISQLVSLVTNSYKLLEQDFSDSISLVDT